MTIQINDKKGYYGYGDFCGPKTQIAIKTFKYLQILRKSNNFCRNEKLRSKILQLQEDFNSIQNQIAIIW